MENKFSLDAITTEINTSDMLYCRCGQFLRHFVGNNAINHLEKCDKCGKHYLVKKYWTPECSPYEIEEFK